MGRVHVRLPSRRDTRDMAARAYTAAGTAVIVTYPVASSAVRYMLPVLVSASVVFAIAVGVTRNRPPAVLPWYLFTAAMAPCAAADTIWGLYQVRDAEVRFRVWPTCSTWAATCCPPRAW